VYEHDAPTRPYNRTRVRAATAVLDRCTLWRVGSVRRGVGDRAFALLRETLGPDAEFRSDQAEAIVSAVTPGGRTLVVQRTGWGKSLVYFIAAKLLREEGAGPSLLISPLLSLMSDQHLAANRLGVRTVAITSDNTGQWPEVFEGLGSGEVDLLMIAPERLANPHFAREVLPRLTGRVALLVVDEAHCISDWGHDFRPDYRRIGRIIASLPREVSVLATTATANQRVVDDIAEQLGSGVTVLRGPLARRSLRLQAIGLSDRADRLAWLAEHLPALPGSGIVYTLTVRDAERVAAWLQSQGIDAHAYHARLSTEDKRGLEQGLRENTLKALVATVALGMGFDKPDLGFVVHYQRPGSVVAYYQQIGRAGRSTEDAYAVLLSGREDDAIHEYFIGQAFPPEELLVRVTDAVATVEDGATTQQLKSAVNTKATRLDQCLTILEVEGAVARSQGRWVRTPVRLALDAERIAQVRSRREAELAEMAAFVRSDRCLMQRAVEALDDPSAERCGRCAICCGSLVGTTIRTDLRNAALEFLSRSAVEILPRKRAPAVLVAGGGTAIPEDRRLRPGFALCSYGDPGVGTLVEQGKWRDGRFSDEVIHAAAEFISRRWHPEPAPDWVVPVPSLRRPELVPDLAQRLAERLGLPFRQAVRCVHQTDEQRTMQNTEHQANNASRAFAVDPSLVRVGPVLLVDDIVDSRWTLTVCGARLRAAGAGPVFPFALASAAGVGNY
jgi:ATP-dependent DNA helicase RecQ